MVALQAAGKLGGSYLILSSQHRLTRSGGYSVELDLCRVKAPSIGFDPQGLVTLNSYGIQSDGEVA
ncbi:hypothetical protein D3C84_1277310 [compost metagenome]